MINIAFRTDASITIGTGHVMRCLTLADALRERGAQCRFICRPHAGHLLDLIAQRGHRAMALPPLNTGRSQPQNGSSSHTHWLGTDWVSDAFDTRQVLGRNRVDWLVVDHYALDTQWEQSLRPASECLMVIDDLADRPHDCDLLLDQNLGHTVEDYRGLTSGSTTMLIGSQYALLRPEFATQRPYSLARRKPPALRHILITMGGVDKDNLTSRVINALAGCPLPTNCRITVVMGLHAPWIEQVRDQAAKLPWPAEVLVNVTDMARLISDSDLAIGGAGTTTWERCCLGIPSLMAVLADNQLHIASALAEYGAGVNLGAAWETAFTVNLRLALDKACHGTPWLSAMSGNAATVADGEGAERVAAFIVGQGKP